MAPRRGINLPIVIAVVMGLGFGASAFLNMAQYARSEQDKKLLRGEITDLKYQVEQDRLAGNVGASPSPSPEASETPSPSPDTAPTPSASPEVAGAAARTMTVRTAATFRSAPNASAAHVDGFPNKLPVGTVVTVTGDKNGSYYPATYNGSNGYLLADALR